MIYVGTITLYSKASFYSKFCNIACQFKLGKMNDQTNRQTKSDKQKSSVLKTFLGM